MRTTHLLIYFTILCCTLAACSSEPEPYVQEVKNDEVRIELIYFDGCTTYKQADENVEQALSRLGLKDRATYIMINASAPDAPEYATKYGSPTILINGIDLIDREPSGQFECRLYDGLPYPSVELIESRLQEY